MDWLWDVLLSPKLAPALQVLTFVVLLVTLIGVWVYTQTTKKQYRHSFRPILTLHTDVVVDTSNPANFSLKKVYLRNIGNGPALNVRIDPIKSGDLEVDFEVLDAISPGEITDLLVDVSELVERQNPQWAHMIDQFITPQNRVEYPLHRFKNLLTSNSKTINGRQVVKFPVKVLYSDLEERRHETHIQLTCFPEYGSIYAQTKKFVFPRSWVEKYLLPK